MKRTRDDQTTHQRADWEWRERHSHEAHEAPRVVVAPVDDAALWEEARLRRVERKADVHRRRRAIGWKNAALLGTTTAVSLVLWFYTAKSYVAYQDFNDHVQSQLAQRPAREDQLRVARARVALLSSDKGRAQLLVERGYVRPRERILQFPGRPAEMEKRRAERISNDLTPSVKPTAPTRWQQLRDSLRGWVD